MVISQASENFCKVQVGHVLGEWMSGERQVYAISHCIRRYTWSRSKQVGDPYPLLRTGETHLEFWLQVSAHQHDGNVDVLVQVQ